MSEFLDFMESLRPGFEQLQKAMQELSDSTHQTSEKDKQIETLRRNNKELAKRLAAKVTHIDNIEKVNCDLQNDIATIKAEANKALEIKDNIIDKQKQENKELLKQIKELTADRDKWKAYFDKMPKITVDPTLAASAMAADNKLSDIVDEVKSLEEQVQEIIAKHVKEEPAAKAPVDPDLKPPVTDASQEDGFDSLESVEIFIDDGTNNPINIKAEGKHIDFDTLFDELLAKLNEPQK